MRELSNSAWKTTWRSLIDALGAATKFPVAYIALAAIMVGQQYLTNELTPQLSRPDATIDQILNVDTALKLFGISFGISLIALLFWVSLLRYFSAEDDRHSYGIQPPFFRMIGWWLGISVVVWGIGAIVAWVSYTMYLQVSPIAGWITFIIFWLILSWLGFRLITLWPALALNEQGSLLKRSFAETKGHVWFMLRSALSGMVLIIAGVFVAMLAWGFLVGFPPPPEPGVMPAPTILSMVVTGVLSTAMLIWGLAFLGRLFRRVRGLA